MAKQGSPRIGDVVYCNDGKGVLVWSDGLNAAVDLYEGGTWRGEYHDVHEPTKYHDGTPYSEREE